MTDHGTTRLAGTTRSTAHFGVIVFLASDVMLFAPFFAAYFLLKANNPPWPPAGVELDVPRAALATLVLVASSFTLVASDRAGERPGGGAAMRRWLLVTIGLGAAVPRQPDRRVRDAWSSAPTTTRTARSSGC